ncbi:HAD superfamily (subfamily IIIA) phosphatase, TIGR01668 [Rippkaea orientalis PCC 8801]|uniref:HAD superfamily (Subfamily IIIA) phosphatase, TIGR01668 n=1 Tax=Rippkaea orientalis (strain PCC 8801 / RF-1) TaxID=41431 RepID=B7K3A1_RIPO1|nr:YqeG family HAD IIIA-type phosphatase [Rippkaea orientalis]ACK64421.1 HAD superfamily (subfamily IIIA) phosphatase, TIGR01668 [Rippkaea orientalis PCC 8801]
MSKTKLLQPDLVLGDNILGLTPEILAHYHIKGLVLDVDETLVPLKKAHVSEELRGWIESIKAQTPIWLVSNNISENRIGRIANSLNVPYLLGAVKPSRRKLRQAVQAMDLPMSRVAMVGDRLFTDVLAGNRLGMFTILVEPMVDAAIAARSYPIHNFEVWLSQKLGVSLMSSKPKFTKHDRSSPK